MWDKQKYTNFVVVPIKSQKAFFCFMPFSLPGFMLCRCVLYALARFYALKIFCFPGFIFLAPLQRQNAHLYLNLASLSGVPVIYRILWYYLYARLPVRVLTPCVTLTQPNRFYVLFVEHKVYEITSSSYRCDRISEYSAALSTNFQNPIRYRAK